MRQDIKNYVFYEIYPNSFKDSNNDGYGDLKGIIEKLDYVAGLGVDGIWLNPHYDSPFNDGGYDVKDYFHTSPRFGTDEDFKQLIEECHKRDILVNAFTQTFRCFEEGSKLLDESYYQLEYDGSLSRGNIYYYDICNDNVQDVLYAWYLELVSYYDFDKIEYDIIRYSQSNLYKYSSVEQITNAKDIIDPGYTEYSMEKFKKQYNLVGDLKQLILQSSDVRSKWLKFKEDELINFITNEIMPIEDLKNLEL